MHVCGIQELDYTISLKKGKINVSDFLSSNPPKPELDLKNQYLDPKLSNELKNVVIKEILT